MAHRHHGPPGGPQHEVMNLGHHAAAWRVFRELTGIEFRQV